MSYTRPATGREYPLKEGTAIISRTDTRGNIVDCNEEFVIASGYEKHELIGQSHNIVRHPDMPAEAFRDMWATLQAGRPWSGLVKNRRKDGDHYWVRATATPLADGSGYMSVRVKPERQEVQAAESLYQHMKGSNSIRLAEGKVIEGGLGVFAPLFAPWKKSVSLRVFAGSLFALLILCLTGWYAAKGINDSGVDGARFQKIVASKDLLADVLPPPAFIIESYLVALEMRHQGAQQLDKHSQRLQKLKQDYEERQAYWKKIDLPGNVQEQLQKQSEPPAQAFFTLAQGAYLTALKSGDLSTADQHLRQLTNLYENHRQQIDTLVKASETWGDSLTKESREFVSQTEHLLLLAILGTALFGSFISWVAARSITTPLNDAGKAADTIASGNLLAPMPQAGYDEIGSLVVKMSIMRNSLHELAAGIRQNVNSLNLSAHQLANSATEAARITHEQSESATSMAASIEELSVSIDQVEEHSRDAHRISTETGQMATTGGKTIHATADGMGHISQTVSGAAKAIGELEHLSNEVSSIVSTIKDIADQTNLLALNAAIEAARAGEMGRGFAVVADEVRKLSERTGTATGEIARMIDRIQTGTRRAADEMQSSVSEVEIGVKRAHEAGSSIISIRASADEVVSSVDGIVDALREQAVAARTIASEVEKIAQGAESNSCTMQQNAREADKLKLLANSLNQLAGRFQIA